MKTRIFFPIIAVFVFACVGFVRAQEMSVAKNDSVSDIDSSHSELRAMIERFNSDDGSLERFYTISISPTRNARMKEFYTSWVKQLGAVPFDGLSEDGKVDYLLFKNYLNHHLRELGTRAKAIAEAAPYVPFADTIIRLRETRQRMQFIDGATAAATMNNLSKQLQVLEKSLETKSGGREEKIAANRAVNEIDELRGALKEWFTFYDGYDPMFSWWVDAPYKAFDADLKTYSAFLKEKFVGVRADDPDAILGDPIGREALMNELAFEMIPYTPDELIDIANKEYAWCEKEMITASRELGYGDDWHKALEHVKHDYVEPGKQPAMIRDLALEAIKFTEDHDLVTIPPLAKETWRMDMLTPEQQKYSPFFLGGEQILVSYPTNTMEHEQKMMSMRGNNIDFARATVFHELIPGHHLQGFMQERYRPYRGIFYTPFWSEGSSLYWEMTFWDLGFPKTPENKIGMLFWRMHRCARIIFSLSFHLGKMTPQEAIEFLIQKVGHERDNATAEVRRSVQGGYGPLYQCAYMLGALQLRALQKEVVGGGKMTNHQFNDAVLKQNAIPIEMVRAALTDQKLTADFKSGWRFYETNK
ncbi:MAG TPA: DUF885 family protein [Bacteroidota bacterium]|nr:DUF885 family protein [Bacteroidota bacterium]